MKKRFWMDCHTVMDTVYESEKDSSLSMLTHIRIGFHLFFCPGCAAELRNLQRLEEIMRTDFLPPSPGFEESIMECLYKDICEKEESDAPAGFSFRGWVIIGFFVLLSLSSSFFGMNFIEIAQTEGLSFLLPVGLTIGMVVTCYGALFIGSHLNELSSRFHRK
jgi:hypothetical protein